MKIIFFILYILLIFTKLVHSQIEIDRSDFAKEGQNFIFSTYEFKPTEKKILSDFGSKVIDFTPYKSIDYDTIEFLNPDSTEFGDQFTKSNLAMYSSRKNLLLLYDNNTEIIEVGNVGDYLGVKAEVVIPFADRFTFMKFPLELHSKYTDSTFKEISIPYHYYNFQDSIRKNIKVWVESTVDTINTIITSYGKFEALREKTTITRIVDGYEFSPHGGWVPAIRHKERSKQTIYRWYAKGEKMAIAEAYANRSGVITKIRYQIDEPIVLTIKGNDLKCKNQNDGSVDLEVKGGIPYYEFEWNNGETSQNLSNLRNGTYTVKVTDNRKRTKEATVTIFEPEIALNVTLTSQQISCFGARNGSITSNIISGHAPYKFIWSNQSKLESITNLSPGKYWVNITDSAKCKASDTIEITQPEKLNIKLTAENVRCKGKNEGKIKSEIVGGTPEYNFQWNNGSMEKDLQNLPSARYSVLVSDKNGCKDSAKVFVKEPMKAFEYIKVANNVNCSELPLGAVRISPKGGYPPYQILWSTGDSIMVLDSLCSGIYSFRLTDANQCTFQDTIKIEEPEKALVLNQLAKSENAFHRDGEIMICVDGGTSPYKYLSGKNKKNEYSHLERLSANAYYFKVLDAKGCQIEDSILVEREPAKAQFIHNTAEPIEISPKFKDKDGFLSLLYKEEKIMKIYNIFGENVLEINLINDELPAKIYELPYGIYSYYIFNQQGQELLHLRFSSIQN